MLIDFPTLSVLPAHARSQNLISQPRLQLSTALGLKLCGTPWSIRLCPGDGPGSGPVRWARTAFASGGRQCSSLKHLNLPFSGVSCCNPHPPRSRCQARLQGARMLSGEMPGRGKPVKSPPKVWESREGATRARPLSKDEKSQRWVPRSLAEGLAKPPGESSSPSRLSRKLLISQDPSVPPVPSPRGHRLGGRPREEGPRWQTALDCPARHLDTWDAFPTSARPGMLDQRIFCKQYGATILTKQVIQGKRLLLPASALARCPLRPAGDAEGRWAWGHPAQRFPLRQCCLGRCGRPVLHFAPDTRPCPPDPAVSRPPLPPPPRS